MKRAIQENTAWNEVLILRHGKIIQMDMCMFCDKVNEKVTTLCFMCNFTMQIEEILLRKLDFKIIRFYS